MNLIASLTVVFPVVVITAAASARFKNDTPSDKIKTGCFLFVALTPTLIGLFSIVPGGSFSHIPPPLSYEMDYVLTLSLAPLIGTLVLATSLIVGGLRRSRKLFSD